LVQTFPSISNTRDLTRTGPFSRTNLDQPDQLDHQCTEPQAVGITKQLLLQLTQCGRESENSVGVVTGVGCVLDRVL